MQVELVSEVVQGEGWRWSSWVLELEVKGEQMLQGLALLEAIRWGVQRLGADGEGQGHSGVDLGSGHGSRYPEVECMGCYLA